MKPSGMRPIEIAKLIRTPRPTPPLHFRLSENKANLQPICLDEARISPPPSN